MRSWWVILFVIGCYLSFEQGLIKRDTDFEKLHRQHLAVKQEYLRAITLQQRLQLQINSQSDLEWVELTLMKGLGLVPEGQTKVVFIQQEP